MGRQRGWYVPIPLVAVAGKNFPLNDGKVFKVQQVARHFRNWGVYRQDLLERCCNGNVTA